MSSDFPEDIASPQLITVSADERSGAGRGEGDAPASSRVSPEVYGYILGDLIFVRRDSVHQVLKALGTSISKSDPGRSYVIRPSATAGLEWTVDESAVTQVSATDAAPLASAPGYARCRRHYMQGRIAHLYCTAPSGYEIDEAALGRSLGLSCQGSTAVTCSSRGYRSVARSSSGLSIPLVALPPVAPPASEGGGA
jgi:hypothetical protein